MTVLKSIILNYLIPFLIEFLFIKKILSYRKRNKHTIKSEAFYKKQNETLRAKKNKRKDTE